MEEEKQGQPEHGGEGAAIKYGDVFDMSGNMGAQPISPRDAAAMESAENRAFGETIKGGPASIMLEAAAKNVKAGLVGPDDTFTSHEYDGLEEGNPWHDSHQSHEQMESAISVQDMGDEAAAGVTIGEALEAAAAAVGDKPVDRVDAASIQAAEMLATGSNAPLGAGLGAEAQAAATVNARMIYDEDKTKISGIIQGATNMLTDDKAATRSDAECVTEAELRGEPEGVIGKDSRPIKHSTTPGGVAEAVATSARINQSDK